MTFVPETREEIRIAASLIGIRFGTVRQWFHRGAIDTRFDALEARVINIETELRQIRKRLDASSHRREAGRFNILN